jgi:hypothetical protein
MHSIAVTTLSRSRDPAPRADPIHSGAASRFNVTSFVAHTHHSDERAVIPVSTPSERLTSATPAAGLASPDLSELDVNAHWAASRLAANTREVASVPTIPPHTTADNHPQPELLSTRHFGTTFAPEHYEDAYRIRHIRAMPLVVASVLLAIGCFISTAVCHYPAQARVASNIAGGVSLLIAVIAVLMFGYQFRYEPRSKLPIATRPGDIPVVAIRIAAALELLAVLLACLIVTVAVMMQFADLSVVLAHPFKGSSFGPQEQQRFDALLLFAAIALLRMRKPYMTLVMGFSLVAIAIASCVVWTQTFQSTHIPAAAVVRSYAITFASLLLGVYFSARRDSEARRRRIVAVDGAETAEALDVLSRRLQIAVADALPPTVFIQRDIRSVLDALHEIGSNEPRAKAPPTLATPAVGSVAASMLWLELLDLELHQREHMAVRLGRFTMMLERLCDEYGCRLVAIRACTFEIVTGLPGIPPPVNPRYAHAHPAALLCGLSVAVGNIVRELSEDPTGFTCHRGGIATGWLCGGLLAERDIMEWIALGKARDDARDLCGSAIIGSTVACPTTRSHAQRDGLLLGYAMASAPSSTSERPHYTVVGAGVAPALVRNITPSACFAASRALPSNTPQSRSQSNGSQESSGSSYRSTARANPITQSGSIDQPSQPTVRGSLRIPNTIPSQVTSRQTTPLPDVVAGTADERDACLTHFAPLNGVEQRPSAPVVMGMPTAATGNVAEGPPVGSSFSPDEAGFALDAMEQPPLLPRRADSLIQQALSGGRATGSAMAHAVNASDLPTENATAASSGWRTWLMYFCRPPFDDEQIGDLFQETTLALGGHHTQTPPHVQLVVLGALASLLFTAGSTGPAVAALMSGLVGFGQSVYAWHADAESSDTGPKRFLRVRLFTPRFLVSFTAALGGCAALIAHRWTSEPLMESAQIAPVELWLLPLTVLPFALDVARVATCLVLVVVTCAVLGPVIFLVGVSAGVFGAVYAVCVIFALACDHTYLMRSEFNDVAQGFIEQKGAQRRRNALLRWARALLRAGVVDRLAPEASHALFPMSDMQYVSHSPAGLQRWGSPIISAARKQTAVMVIRCDDPYRSQGSNSMAMDRTSDRSAHPTPSDHSASGYNFFAGDSCRQTAADTVWDLSSANVLEQPSLHGPHQLLPGAGQDAVISAIAAWSQLSRLVRGVSKAIRRVEAARRIYHDDRNDNADSKANPAGPGAAIVAVEGDTVIISYPLDWGIPHVSNHSVFVPNGSIRTEEASRRRNRTEHVVVKGTAQQPVESALDPVPLIHMFGASAKLKRTKLKHRGMAGAVGTLVDIARTLGLCCAHPELDARDLMDAHSDDDEEDGFVPCALQIRAAIDIGVMGGVLTNYTRARHAPMGDVASCAKKLLMHAPDQALIVSGAAAQYCPRTFAHVDPTRVLPRVAAQTKSTVVDYDDFQLPCTLEHAWSRREVPGGEQAAYVIGL